MLADGLCKGRDEFQRAVADLDRAPETEQKVALSTKQIGPEIENRYRVLHNQVPVGLFVEIQEVRIVVTFLHASKLSVPSQRIIY